MFKNKLSKNTINIIKKVLLCFAVIGSLIITYGPNFNPKIPNWNLVYETLGVASGQNLKTYSAPLVVSFIDVGQGDSTYIKARLTDGSFCNILIDSGESGSESKILPLLSAYGTDELVYVVGTHPHSDHVGAMPEILKGIKVKNYLYPFNTEVSSAITSELNGANCINAKAGNSFIVSDNLRLEVLSPSKEYDNENDMSLVIKLTYGNTSFLFTGDAESAAEYSLMSGSYTGKWSIHSDVLKVGHHGSDSSSGEDFISSVSPSYAVISCGKNNDYGHPHAKTLGTLQSHGIKVLRTDELGTVVICSDGNTLFLP